MKHAIPRTALAFALAAWCIGASAQSGTTREQVRAELAQAIRSGDIISGESGLTLREQFPNRYPQRPKPAGLTREQVKAELAEALRTGQVIAGGEIGARPADGIPSAFPRELLTGEKTRAEVRQELAEAIRTGDILAAGESGLLLRQQNPGRYATVAAPKGNPDADRMAAMPMH